MKQFRNLMATPTFSSSEIRERDETNINGVERYMYKIHGINDSKKELCKGPRITQKRRGKKLLFKFANLTE